MAENLVQRDLDVLWHPCAQMRDYNDFAPIEIIGAEGCELELAGGRRVIDAISSWWCKALGHKHPRITAALIEQAQRFEHVILANTTNQPIVQLCERLLAACNGLGPEAWGPGADPGRQPGHFGKVFFADNGSTAVEVAIKMALQAQQQRGQPQRTRFAALSGGYHGETVATLAVGDCGLYGAPYRPLMFDVPMLGPLPLRSGPDDPLWMDASAEWPAIEAQLAPIAADLAAIIYEPVLQGAGGMRVYSPDLLRRLRHWADAHDVYIIADEIAAGFGRCGKMLASHHADDQAMPDFACVSKGLTAGYLPLSAVCVTDSMYELFLSDYFEHRAFMHSNTYTGNALAIAVANAVFDVFADDAILERIAHAGPLLRTTMERVASETSCLTNIRSVGMMTAADLCTGNGQALDPKQRTGYQVYQAAVERGAWLRPLGDTLYFFPPFTISDGEIERLGDTTRDSIIALLA